MTERNHQHQPTTSRGVTASQCTDYPTERELKITEDLKDTLLKCGGCFKSGDDISVHRIEVVCKINELVKTWIKDINEKKNLPDDLTKKVLVKLLPFGSFKMGVDYKGADIDILCICSRHVSRDDFFCSFVQLLREQPEVESLRTVENAFVPVVKMTFAGVEIDIVYARLALKSIEQNLDLRDDKLLKNLDSRCIRSFNGYRITEETLELVPNKNSFKVALKSIKLWAKRHKIYSNTLGYLGGVSWGILVARICQMYPNAVPSTIINKFFIVFKGWSRKNPVLLKELKQNELNFRVWDSKLNRSDRNQLMAIITPAYPYQNSSFNVTSATKAIIEKEIENGLQVTNDIMSGESKWDEFFAPVNITALYKHFIILIVTSKGESQHLMWSSLVKSKIRFLLSSIEFHPDISLVHIDDKSIQEKYLDMCKSQWLIGLQFIKSHKIKIDLTYAFKHFTDIVTEKAISSNLYEPSMTVEIKHIRKKELANYFPATFLHENENNDQSTSSRSLPVSNKRPNHSESSDFKRKCL